MGRCPISLSQATFLNPDGHPGPLRCATCHVVDVDGVATNVTNDMLAPFSKEIYPTRYERAVALSHTARTYEEIHGPGK